MMLFWGKKWEEVHILSFFTLFDTDTKLCINPKILKTLIHVSTQVIFIYTFEVCPLFGLCP